MTQIPPMLHKVEFRLLQVVLSHVGDDRLTVLYLQRDGETMRVATDVPSVNRLQASVGGIRASVKWVAREILKVKGPGALAEVYPVREGFGYGVLRWTPVVTVETLDPEAYFKLMREEFKLRAFPGRPKQAWPKRKPAPKAAQAE